MSNTRNTTPGWRILEAPCSWLLMDAWFEDVKIKATCVQHVWLHEIRGTFFYSSSPLPLFFFYFTRQVADSGEVIAKIFFFFQQLTVIVYKNPPISFCDNRIHCIIAHHTPNPSTPGEGNDCMSLFKAHKDRSLFDVVLIDWCIV